MVIYRVDYEHIKRTLDNKKISSNIPIKYTKNTITCT